MNPDVSKLALISKILFWLVMAVTVFCFVTLIYRGLPKVVDERYYRDGISAIYEISEDEYLRLFTVERISITSMLAAVRTWFMVGCCYTDDIK